MVKGAIFREDLINRFEVGLSAGSRDFKLYKELAQAILKNKVFSVIYSSISSDSVSRWLVPHSIVDNGQR